MRVHIENNFWKSTYFRREIHSEDCARNMLKVRMIKYLGILDSTNVTRDMDSWMVGH